MKAIGFNSKLVFQVAFICSLVNGKIFMEWVSPAVLKAYQWQVSDYLICYVSVIFLFIFSFVSSMPN